MSVTSPYGGHRRTVDIAVRWTSPYGGHRRTVDVVDVELYATPGPLTDLYSAQASILRDLHMDPLGLCRVAQRLLVAPIDAFGAGLSDERMVERNTRPAAALLQRALDLDASLQTSRTATQRVVGTCRHYAVLATAFLRATNVPARARCGFASYFLSPRKVDHWITEYWKIEMLPLGRMGINDRHDRRGGFRPPPFG